MEKKRLYLSDSDKKICGVCGGIAEYFNIDSTVVRLATILLLFCTVLIPVTIAYFVAAVVIPEKPENN